jgi:3-methyladenine DNA glycosylase AlkD
MTAKAIRAELRSLADPERATLCARFFKAGPGEYGEGDRFLGATVPQQRKLATCYQSLALRSVRSLLQDHLHECRLTALFILVDQFERGAEVEREPIVRCYLDHLDFVNNWDLVDASAHKLLGAWLEHRDRSILYELAASGHLWRQRVAVIATAHFIKRGDFDDTLALAAQLRDHEHDLIHKAVGWMLREVGNRDRAAEEGFLVRHCREMPRTMLRYAIERFEPQRRKAYLAGTPLPP